MQINYNYEPEILLKDMFFDLLYHWRSIIVAALVGAVLLTGYQFYAKPGTGKASESAREKYALALEEYQANVDTYKSRIATYTSLIEEQQNYMSRSVFLNLDPGTICSEVRSYLVKLKPSGDEVVASDPVDELLAMYTYMLTDNLDSQQMAAMLGSGEKNYIDELVSLVVNIESNTMELTVYGPSYEVVAEASEFFSNRLMSLCSAQLQDVYPHELIPAGNYRNQRNAQSQLADTQQKLLQNLTKYQTAVTDAEKALKKLTKPSMPKENKSRYGAMAAIGFAVFALLAAAFHGVRYLANECLHDRTEMSRRYGISVFEDATHSRARHPGKGLDRLIELWEFGDRQKDAAEAGRQVATLLGGRMAGGSKLVLLSTRPDEALQAMRSALAEGLGARDIQISTCARCVLEDGISNIPADATLLIVEEKYRSRITEINREAELVSLLGLAPAGAVLV